MTAWQRLTSLWRTNSRPQTFSFNNEWHELHELLVTFVSFVVSFINIKWNGLHGFWLHFRTCLGINFCPLSPKPMNSYNLLIIMDITYYLPIKSPKIHEKSLLLYIFFANFLSCPFSKLPDPNDVVSSINAYGLNSWHLVSYEGWEKATEERKNAIKCLFSAIYYIFFVLCARIGI